MLSGKELGHAIEQAINRKISSGAVKTKAEIARHFKIKPPSIHDWIKKGSISKDKLPELWGYFSDVVGPEHWGLKELPPFTHSDSSQQIENKSICDAYELASDERRVVIDFLLSIGKSEPSWVDADVRAYVSTLDSKARQYLAENKPLNQSRKPQKTGT